MILLRLTAKNLLIIYVAKAVGLFHSLFTRHRIVFELAYQLLSLQLDESMDANDLAVLSVCLSKFIIVDLRSHEKCLKVKQIIKLFATSYFSAFIE